MQQRLNSLSFYDSIPLYDSMGHRTGGVARAAQHVQETNLNLGAQPKSKTNGVACSKSDQGRRSGPYWANLQPELDSDHDSAVYAELDKQLSDSCDTPRTLPCKRREASGGRSEMAHTFPSRVCKAGTLSHGAGSASERGDETPCTLPGSASKDNDFGNETPCTPSCRDNRINGLDSDAPCRSANHQKKSKGYALHLEEDKDNSEDIYTHV